VETNLTPNAQVILPARPGHDQVSIKWDDRGVGIGVALAAEFRFVGRADKECLDSNR